MTTDAQGLALSAGEETAPLLDQAIYDYLAWRGDPVGTLATATEADPGFALGHAAIASLMLLGGVPGSNGDVQARLEAAAALPANARERAHLAAADAFAAGAMVKATDIWEAILIDYPTDALALRFAHDSYFYLGHSFSIRDSIARVLDQWDRDDPLYGFVLGQYAFGLEEAGDLAKAEAMGRAALARNAEDAWATHAVAHVLEMTSRQAEGIAFLRETRPDWSKGIWLSVHNGWHLALYLIEAGRGHEVLADYDAHVAPKIAGDSLLDLVDASALLWRLELAGIDVGPRWQAIAAQWLTHVDDHVLAFNDLHIAMAAARAGRGDDVAALRRSLDTYQAGDDNADNRAITRDVGRSVIEGVLAHAEGDHAAAVGHLLPCRYKWIRIGGSHAQRDLLNQTLIDAAEKSGQHRLAHALWAERAGWRPTTPVLERYASSRRRLG